MSTATSRGRRAPRHDPDKPLPHPWNGRETALLVERAGDTHGKGHFLDDLAKLIASYRAIGRDFPYARAVDDDGKPAFIPHPGHPQVASQLWVRIQGLPS